MSRIQNLYSCPKKWNELSGEGSVRDCDSCNHSVHDLTIKSDAEVDALLENGPICGRIQRSRLLPGLTSMMAGLTMASVATFGALASFAQTGTTTNDSGGGSAQPNLLPSIKGFLKDSVSGEPVPFAKVVLKIGNEIVQGTQSDFDGNFSVSIDTTAVTWDNFAGLEISFSGYKTLKIERLIVDFIKAPLTLNMETSGELKNVVIQTGMVHRHRFIGETSNAQTIDRTELIKMP